MRSLGPRRRLMSSKIITRRELPLATALIEPFVARGIRQARATNVTATLSSPTLARLTPAVSLKHRASGEPYLATARAVAREGAT